MGSPALARPSGTVTFLFSDVEGSTRLLERDARALTAALKRHHEVIAEAIAQHGGTVFETVGDAVYAAFPEPSAALVAAAKVQRNLAAEDWGALGEIRVRIAIHAGVVESRSGGHYSGSALFQCARLEALATGGQVLASSVVAELVAGGLPGDLRLRHLGRHRLKDLAEPIDVFVLEGPGLPTDFGPLRAAVEVPTNLPLRIDAFVGREESLAKIGDLLRERRLVTLLGPGGVGKTRLAIEVAASIKDAFPDGVFIAELAPITEPALVPSTVAGALGLPAREGAADDSTLLAFLAPRRLLLVLDNFEQVLAGAASVARWMTSAPGLTVMATSRSPLRLSGEQRYRVEPLSVTGTNSESDGAIAPAAVQLFIERAAEVVSGFRPSAEDVGDITAICRRLDGLPLAIELAAARMDLLGPAAMRAAIESRHAIPAQAGPSAPARHQTLQRTVAWSLDLLDESDRRAFASLGVFPADFGLDAAQTVLGRPEEGGPADVLETLLRLADASLITARKSGPEPRFGMYETVRAEAAALLAGAPAETARARHATWALALAEAGEQGIVGPEPAASIARVDANIDDIRSALEWALLTSNGDLGGRITGAMWHYWLTRSMFDEGAALAERVLNLEMDPRWRARSLNSLAIMVNFRDHYPHRVLELFEEAAALAQVHGSLAEAADLVNNTGTIRWRLGLGEARGQEELERSVALWNRAGDPRGESIPTENLADLAFARGDPVAALELGRRGYDLALASGSPTARAMSARTFGNSLLLAGDFDEANRYLDIGLRGLARLGSWIYILDALIGKALVRQRQARPDWIASARLLGAHEAYHRRRNLTIERLDQAIVDDAHGAGRAALGSSAWDVALAEGAALDEDAVIAYAVGDRDPFVLDAGG